MAQQRPPNVTVWETAQQIVRIIFQFIAGSLVSKGFVDESMVFGLVGAAMSIFALIWWTIADKLRRDEINEARAHADTL
jgi:5-bromo-4-chloroindolyl phosphate hydrolysis protein